MKLNLGCGKDVRSGYLNIDRLPLEQMSQEVYKQGDIDSLDWLTEDNTVDEIVALDCLEYLPIDIIKQAISNWARKLIAGGVMKIMVPDCHAIAKAFSQGQLNLPEYSYIIFGTQKDDDNKLSVIDTVTLISILEQNKLNILLKRYEGMAIYVEVSK